MSTEFGEPRRSKKPTFPLCKQTAFMGHDAIEWTCRHCAGKACANCSHRYGWNRTPVLVEGPHERFFTCGACYGKLAGKFIETRKSTDGKGPV